MATDDTLIEVPLFVGMGEGNDSQSRTVDAVVSENVSFQKSGAIKTRRYLDVVAQDTNTLEGVAYADGEFYVNSATQLRQVQADNVLGNPVNFTLPQKEIVSYLKTSSMSVGWVRSVVVGDYVAVSWLEGASVGYNLLIALFDSENNVVQAPLQVYGGAIPSYELLATPTGVALVHAKAGVGNPTNNGEVGVTFCTVTGSSLTVGSYFSQTLEKGYPKSVSACVTSTDIVVATHSWSDVLPSARYTTQGSTDITRVTFAGTATHASIATEATSQVYSGELLCVTGYDSVEDVVWLAISNSMKIQVCPVVGLVPGTLADLSTATPAGVYDGSVGQYHEVPNSARTHFSQLMCGRFAFSGTSRWLAVTSFDHPRVIDNVYENATRNYAHLALFQLPAAPAGATATYTSPHTLLAGTPYIDAEGAVKVPVCVSDCWHYNDVVTSGTSKISAPTTSVGHQNMTEDGSVGASSLASEPLYYAAGIAEVVNAELLITSVFGFDEVRPQNGVTLAINMNLPWALQQVRAESYNSPIGGLLLFDGALKFYHPRRRVNAGVPYNGAGTISEGFLQADAWNHSLAVSDLSTQHKLRLVGGRDFLVASTGVASIVDDGFVFPTASLVPPDPGVGLFSGTGGALELRFLRKFVAVWAWLDRKGVYHRGPPSHEVGAQFDSWDVAADTATAYVSGYPRLQGADLSQVYLEIYAEPVASGVVVPGTFVLIHRQPVGDRVPSFQAHMKNSDLLAPLLYTTGGVLPSEARPSQGSLVVAKGRVWSFDKNQVFYSNEVGVDLPVEFNSNLFIDSPDGTPFTGIASMDEQVVLFTQKGVHVARGPGVNRLGSGPGFNLASITSPTGCRNEASVVATDKGVVFLGERGLHLLGRDFQVTFLRAVEDSFPSSVTAAVYDRTSKEVLFVTSEGTFVWDTESALWTKANLTRTVANDAVWTVDGLAAVADDTLLRTSGTPLVTFPKETSPPMKHSTPWVTLDTAQGYQRVKRFLIQGRVALGSSYIPEVQDEQGQVVTPSRTIEIEPNAFLTVKVYTDHSDVPTQTEVFDLRTVARDPLELAIHNSTQKCRAFRLEFETVEANLDLILTSVVALVGQKKGLDKREPSGAS